MLGFFKLKRFRAGIIQGHGISNLCKGILNGVVSLLNYDCQDYHMQSHSVVEYAVHVVLTLYKCVVIL